MAVPSGWRNGISFENGAAHRSWRVASKVAPVRSKPVREVKRHGADIEPFFAERRRTGPIPIRVHPLLIRPGDASIKRNYVAKADNLAGAAGCEQRARPGLKQTCGACEGRAIGPRPQVELGLIPGTVYQKSGLNSANWIEL